MLGFNAKGDPRDVLGFRAERDDRDVLGFAAHLEKDEDFHAAPETLLYKKATGRVNLSYVNVDIYLSIYLSLSIYMSGSPDCIL